MNIKVFGNSEELGAAASLFCENAIRSAIEANGEARIVLSTGASQFDTIKNLIQGNIDWSKVEMFHLDEYVNLPESHPASFRRYLKDRFISHVNLKKVYLVDGEGDVKEKLVSLSAELLKKPVDLALIGIGENAHIAFNDPPADFETRDPFILVRLNDACKRQQVGEGWFPSVDEMPSQAITMTPYQIMQSKTIISCVPHKVKAQAVKDTLENDTTNAIPATLLKGHRDYTLFLDDASASLVDKEILEKHK